MSNPKATSETQSPGLADPTTLGPYHRKPKNSTSGTGKPGEELLQVVIETPRGSRNKYSFDPEQRVFRLKSQLPAGMVFPFDFGFVPQTKGGDGDPLDVLVLMDEPAFTGCVLLVRLLGVIEVEQTENDKTERNDRLIAAAETSQVFANFKTVDDLPEQLRKEIDQFFHNYHSLQGKQSRTLAWKKPDTAAKLIESARQQDKAE